MIPRASLAVEARKLVGGVREGGEEGEGEGFLLLASASLVLGLSGIHSAPFVALLVWEEGRAATLLTGNNGQEPLVWW